MPASFRMDIKLKNEFCRILKSEAVQQRPPPPSCFPFLSSPKEIPTARNGNKKEGGNWMEKSGGKFLSHPTQMSAFSIFLIGSRCVRVWKRHVSSCGVCGGLRVATKRHEQNESFEGMNDEWGFCILFSSYPYSFVRVVGGLTWLSFSSTLSTGHHHTIISALSREWLGGKCHQRFTI